MKIVGIAALAALAACQPTSRTAAYFEAHPQEAARTISACATGAKRGADCQAAATSQSNARLRLFRKGFR